MEVAWVPTKARGMDTNEGKPSWQVVVVALGFMALVGVMFWRATESGDFASVWAGVGPIVGVLTGAIPSYFFRRDEKSASIRAEALAAAAGPDAVAQARISAPRAFARDWGYGPGAANETAPGFGTGRSAGSEEVPSEEQG